MEKQMKYGLLAVFNKNKSWLGMQLEQSQGEGNVLVPGFVLLQLWIYCPSTSPGCWQLPRVLPSLHTGWFSFQTSEMLNNAAAHQREERMIPHHTGAVGHTFPVLPVLPASGQFGSSLADEPSCSSLIKALC